MGNSEASAVRFKRADITCFMFVTFRVPIMAYVAHSRYRTQKKISF